jgi:hypothetical protein
MVSHVREISVIDIDNSRQDEEALGIASYLSRSMALAEICIYN